jgi:voltage-gated potassium channel Kch
VPEARAAEPFDGFAARGVLLLGQGTLADTTGRALEAGGASVWRLAEPSDHDIREALAGAVDTVVVVSRSDVVSLRLALVVEHLRPGIPLLVTIFSHGVAEELERTVENLRVLSMADIVAPAFAGPCLDPELMSLAGDPSAGAGATKGIGAPSGEPERQELAIARTGPPSRTLRALEALVRPFDPSARILVIGLVGFVGVLTLETVVAALALGLSPVDAIYATVKVTVTVGPNAAADAGPAWFKLFSGFGMLLTLGFAAVLTAGLVNRLLDRRLTGILGRSAVPRRDHVVVVGLGQVGLRLSLLLRQLGVPVVAIERDDEAPNVARAKEERVPVVLGRGESQRVLRRVSLGRARALAAVTSDELENIAVSVAARGVRGDLNIALRAGDGDVSSEVRSLFHLGVVRDVHRIAGTALAAIALGYRADTAFPYEGTLYLVDREGAIEPFVPVANPGAG